MNQKASAEIGIFGGSGFYDFLKKGRQINIRTPYGRPSDRIFIGEFEGKKIAFLPRHGSRHQYPPHKIPYKANLYAFKSLGVKTIIAPVSVGSLQAHIKPGDFVALDQFVNMTHGRQDSYFEGNETKNKFSKIKVAHISSAEPYCLNLRKLAAQAAKNLKIKMHSKGTVVVINGPRFASRAESENYQRQGWDVINMTQYPECILARELEMCYLGIALVTDYDAGLKGRSDVRPVSFEEIIKVFHKNNETVKELIFEIIKKIPAKMECGCKEALKYAAAG
ncbi:MAG: S-methyl-5'-thioadenosine phosphorylase [bacterium]